MSERSDQSSELPWGKRPVSARDMVIMVGAAGPLGGGTLLIGLMGQFGVNRGLAGAYPDSYDLLCDLNVQSRALGSVLLHRRAGGLG